MKYDEEKKEWKMWAVHEWGNKNNIPVRIFSIKKNAIKFAKESVQDGVVQAVNVTAKKSLSI